MLKMSYWHGEKTRLGRVVKLRVFDESYPYAVQFDGFESDLGTGFCAAIDEVFPIIDGNDIMKELCSK